MSATNQIKLKSARKQTDSSVSLASAALTNTNTRCPARVSSNLLLTKLTASTAMVMMETKTSDPLANG